MTTILTQGDDNNQNLAYVKLDDGIRNTYAACSTAANKNALYDSYVRAIRWASDRIGDNGIVGYISGNGFIDKASMDGLRKTLIDEYTSIYVLNLRGDIRKNMLSKGAAKEGQNIFGSGSMTGIAITFFVKNKERSEHGNIYYSDIGDDLSEAEKKGKLQENLSISALLNNEQYALIVPDKYNDWINKRNDDFYNFIPLGSKEKIQEGNVRLFNNFSRGIETARDAWCFNFSKKRLAEKMKSTARFYNDEVDRYQGSVSKDVKDFINKDETKISWSSSLVPKVPKGIKAEYLDSNIVKSIYRPFQRQWFYYDSLFNHRVGQMPSIFPNDSLPNVVICVSGVGNRSGFSTLIMNRIPSLDNIEKGQCFPLYLYEYDNGGYSKKSGLSKAGVNYFLSKFDSHTFNSEDVFYYIYGLLHSLEYRSKFKENLIKSLPRIPCVKTVTDFKLYSQAGRDLAELHLNYEKVECYPVKLELSGKSIDELTSENYHVTKMKQAKTGKNKDLTTVVYNDHITIKGIPPEAYDYIVNGKPALDWVIDRQGISTDKKSGIVNDANDWAIATMGTARYPLELFQRVITVSLETMKIVKNLPKLDI